MVYQYKNAKGQTYYLHGKVVHLRSKRDQQIYFFAREVRPDAMEAIPAGFIVAENKRTGLPTLKRG